MKEDLEVGLSSYFCAICQKPVKLTADRRRRLKNGITDFFCGPVCRAKYFGKARVKHNLRFLQSTYSSGYDTTILAIPKTIWAWAGEVKNVKVEVDRPSKQVLITPLLKIRSDGKPLSARTYTYHLKLPSKLFDLPLLSPEIGNDMSTIFCKIDDLEVLRIFEFWAAHKMGTCSIKDLNYATSSYQFKVDISFLIWPANAEYCLIERAVNTKGGPIKNRFNLVPVTKSGFISKGVDQDLGSYVGIENCLKVFKMRKRYRCGVVKFGCDNRDLHLGEYRFIGRTKEGILQFKANVKEAYRVKQDELTLIEKRNAKALKKREAS